MTDNEIIKGLEEMAADCEYNFSAKVLALINRQKAEIERLQECPKCVYAYDGETMEYCVEGPCQNFKTAAEIRAEAIKEFAERLKEKGFADEETGEGIVCVEDIDNLVKEMVGEE